jgi:hypothetical protein
MDGGRFTQLDWLEYPFPPLIFDSAGGAKVKENPLQGRVLQRFHLAKSPPSAVSQAKDVRQAGNHAANVSIYTNERCSEVEPGRKKRQTPRQINWTPESWKPIFTATLQHGRCTS